MKEHELLILNTIAAALNRETDLATVLQTVLETLAEVTPTETGWVWLLDETSAESYLAASYNLPPALRDHPRRMYGGCACLDDFNDGLLERTEQFSTITCSRLKNLKEGTRGLLYHASAPLYRGDKKLGILNLTRKNWEPMPDRQLRLIHTVADMLGVAIERARLFDRSTALGAAEERNRIAREIHDTLAQGLASVALRLEAADLLIESGADPNRVRKSIAQALEITRANLEEARRSVLDLRAEPLEGRTLAEALSTLIGQRAQDGNLEWKLHTVGDALPLSVRVEMGLYRIAQEATQNIVRHAGATRMDLSLTATPTEIRLTITDDGRGGVDVESVPGGHFGLVGMTERARLLGGRLEICSTPGAGTTVEAIIPLEVSS